MLDLVPHQVRAFDLWPTRFQLTPEWNSGTYHVDQIPLAKYVPVPGGEEYLLVAGDNLGPPFSLYRSCYTIYDSRHRTLEQLNLKWTVCRAEGKDVDRDGVNELIVSFLGDTVAGLRIYDWPSLDLISEFDLYERDYRWRGVEHWDIYLNVIDVVDTPSVAEPSLVITVQKGFARMPCGVMLINPRNGKEIWHYWIASSVGRVVPTYVVDINGDGLSEIVGGTGASCNGAVLGNTRDDHSYVYALDMKGNQLWLRDFSVPFSHALAVFAAQPPPPRFIVLLTSYTPGTQDQLMVLDAATGRTIRDTTFMDTAHGRTIYPWNSTAYGRQQWLVTGDGVPSLLVDQELRIQACNAAYPRAMGVEDLNDDGVRELLCAGLDGAVEVRDPEFRLMAVSQKPGDIALTLHRPDRPWHDIYANYHDQVVCYSLTRRSHYTAAVTGRLAGGSVLLLLIVFGPVWTVRARASHLRAKRERLQNRAWAAMASKLAHEVRSPLSVLRLSSQNLEMEFEQILGSIPENLRHYFETLRAETDRTENVTRGLLKFARQAPPVLETLDLGSLIRQTAERHPHSPEVRVEIDIEDDLPPATVDHQQVVSLVDNLISNSLKAIKDSGRLEVRLHLIREMKKHRETRDMFELIITDTGRGIPAQDLPRVFELYFSHSEGGTGLGMAIVKQIVEDHYGTIDIQSTVGVGTAVTVRLPVHPVARNDETA